MQKTIILRRGQTDVLKHHLNLASFIIREGAKKKGVEVRSEDLFQTSVRQQGSGEGCEAPCPWLVDASHSVDTCQAMMFP